MGFSHLWKHFFQTPPKKTAKALTELVESNKRLYSKVFKDVQETLPTASCWLTTFALPSHQTEHKNGFKCCCRGQELVGSVRVTCFLHESFIIDVYCFSSKRRMPSFGRARSSRVGGEFFVILEHRSKTWPTYRLFGELQGPA